MKIEVFEDEIELEKRIDPDRKDTVRGFFNPNTGKIGVQGNNREHTSYELAQHEVTEKMIAKGELDAEAVVLLAGENIDKSEIDAVIDVYERSNPRAGRAGAMKELVCDAGDHINQLRYDVDHGLLPGEYFRELADLFDRVLDALHPVVVRETRGAVELDETEYSTKLTINRSWKDQLKNHRHSDTLVAQSNTDLFMADVKNLPMAVPISVISKAQSGKDVSHSVSDASIAKIPDGMRNAPIVIDNPERNSIVYVTDIKDNGGLVVVSFLKNQTFDGDLVHKATSIHTRTNPMGMLKNVEKGSTVYVRKNKLDVVPGSSLLNAGTLNSNIKFIDNTVPQPAEEVKSNFSRKLEPIEELAQKNAELQRRVEYWKGQTKKTEGIRPLKQDEVRKTARGLIGEYGTVFDREEKAA